MATKLHEPFKVPIRGVKPSPEVVLGPSMDPKGQEHEPVKKSIPSNGEEVYHQEEHNINQKVCEVF